MKMQKNLCTATVFLGGAGRARTDDDRIMSSEATMACVRDVFTELPKD